ncbi:hypothetical protein CSC03_1735 [Enterobacter hormaechei]|nr:hypothetical protein CSC03_1735 [Enterobacter hormaechei]
MICFTVNPFFLDKMTMLSITERKLNMENNNRLMPHIRRTTHIMMFAHRNCFDFHLFNAR